MSSRHYHNPMLDTRRVRDLRELVEGNAELYGDAPVYVYKEGRERRSYSYKDLRENSETLAAAFVAMGLFGETVAVFGEAHPAYMTVFYAVVNSGGTIVPLDKELSDEEIAAFLSECGARAVFAMPSQAGRVEPFAERLPQLRYIIEGKPIEDPSPKVLSYDTVLQKGREAIAAGERAYFDHKIDVERPCEILFTSGTTGTSKGVLLSQKNLAAAAMASCDVIDYLTPGTRLVSVLPMNHTYEVTCSHLASQYFGTVTFLNDSLKYVSRNIREFQPDILVLVPLFLETMHKKIWDEVARTGQEKKVHLGMKLSGALLKVGVDVRRKLFRKILDGFGGNLKWVIAGGAAVKPRLIEDLRAFGIAVEEGYGITECAPLVAVNRLGEERLGSVGPPVPGCRVRIDKEKPQDETGEVLVQGDNVMVGYYRNEEASAAAFTEDGWFRTGDIGYLDKDGYLFLTGRKKNVIVLSNGKNVFPEELEERLAALPGIAECAVIGRETDGEPVITALIYPDFDYFKGKSKEEIAAALREEVASLNRSLPSYKQMQRFEVRDTEFEKTTTRKIKRYLLK